MFKQRNLLKVMMGALICVSSILVSGTIYAADDTPSITIEQLKAYLKTVDNQRLKTDPNYYYTVESRKCEASYTGTKLTDCKNKAKAAAQQLANQLAQAEADANTADIARRAEQYGTENYDNNLANAQANYEAAQKKVEENEAFMSAFSGSTLSYAQSDKEKAAAAAKEYENAQDKNNAALIGLSKDQWAQNEIDNAAKNKELQAEITALNVKCASGDKSACTQVKEKQADYTEQVKKQTEEQKALKEQIDDAQKAYDKQYSSDLKAANKAASKAEKDLKSANKDIDKYCDSSSKKYDATKCQEAQAEKADAEKRQQEAQNDISTLNENRNRTQQGYVVSEAKAAAEKEAAEEAARAAAAEEAKNNEIINSATDKKKEAAAQLETAKKACEGKTGNDKTQCEAAAQTAYDNSIAQIDKDVKNAQTALTNAKYGNTKEQIQASKDRYNDAKTLYNTAQKCKASPSSCTESDLAALGVGSAEELTDEKISELQNAADKAYLEYKDASSNAASANIKKEYDEAADKKQSLENELSSLKEQLEEAKKACEHNSTLTSKAGQEAAQKSCAEVAALEQQIAGKEQELDEVKGTIDNLSDAMAESGVAQSHEGEVFMGTPGQGLADYSASGDIFHALSMRAFAVLFGLKKIVYVFAGFGLIGFAYMALVNKLSWKWFANIGIGLFLVANMGRFIEYFVFPTSCSNGICTGPQYQQGSLSYGDNLSKGMGDTEWGWIPESALYVEPDDASINGILQDGAATPEYTEKARGFCGGTAGASFLSNFTSCVKDITAAGKKAVSAVNTAKQTINQVKSTVQTVTNAAKNIGDMAGKIASGDFSNIEDYVKAIGEIGSNINNIAGATGGLTNNIIKNVGNISNDLQDVTKSTDQVAELEAKRASGEGTNAVDRFLKGQTVGADGQVERLYGGEIAQDDNIVSKIQDTADAIKDTSSKANSVLQDNVKNVSSIASTIGNSDLVGKVLGKDGSINDSIADKKKAKEEAKQQAAAEQKAAEQKAAAEQRAAEQKAKAEEEKNQQWLNQQRQEENTGGTEVEQSVNKAKDAVAAAREAEAQYKAAASDASNKQTALKNAQAAADSKNATAEKLKAQKEEACKSGNTSQCSLYTNRYNIAEAEATAANNKLKDAQAAADKANSKLEEAKKPLQELADNARTESKETAQKIKEQSEENIKVLSGGADVEGSIAYEQAQEEKLSAETQKAKEEYEAAREAALASGSSEDVAKAREAEEKYKASQEALSKQQKAVKEKEEELQSEKKKVDNANIFIAKVDAEMNGLAMKDYEVIDQDSVTEKELQKQEQEKAKAEEEAQRLREQYAASQTASKKAEAANQAANKAEADAKNAANQAAQKERAAEQAAKKAEEAAKLAAESGDPVAKRAAEQAAKRAELAAQEAAAAKKEAAEKAKPVAELQEKARQASIEEAKANQEAAKKEKAAAEAAIQAAREEATAAAAKVKAAQQNLDELVKVAKEKNDAESILAAQEAYKEVQKLQQESQAAQNKIDEEIKRRNEADMRYYEEATRQAELENPKSNYGTNNGDTPFVSGGNNSSNNGSSGGNSSGTSSSGGNNTSGSSTSNKNNPTSGNNFANRVENEAVDTTKDQFANRVENEPVDTSGGSFADRVENDELDPNKGNLADRVENDEDVEDNLVGKEEEETPEQHTGSSGYYYTPKKVFSSWTGRATARGYSSGRVSSSSTGTVFRASSGGASYSNTGKGSSSDTASRARQFQAQEAAAARAAAKLNEQRQEEYQSEILRQKMLQGDAMVEERIRQSDIDADQLNREARQRRLEQLQSLKDSQNETEEQRQILVNEKGVPVLDKNGNEIPVAVDDSGKPILDENGSPIPLVTDNKGRVLLGADGKPRQGKIEDIVTQ